MDTNTTAAAQASLLSRLVESAVGAITRSVSHVTAKFRAALIAFAAAAEVLAAKVDARVSAIEAELLRASHDRGQTNLTGLFIGILISGIVTMGVFIPVWNDVLASSNVTGTTKTILEYVPLFAGLMLLVAIAGPLMRRV